jgi:hypothetical protein
LQLAQRFEPMASAEKNADTPTRPHAPTFLLSGAEDPASDAKQRRRLDR